MLLAGLVAPGPPRVAPDVAAFPVSLFEGQGVVLASNPTDIAVEPPPEEVAPPVRAEPAPATEEPPAEAPQADPAVATTAPDNVLALARQTLADAASALSSEPIEPSAQEDAPPSPAALSASSGSDCNLEGPVQAALQASAPALAALDTVPRANRSVANAIMLWDGAWVDAAKHGGPAVTDPLQAVIAAAVAAAPAECRESLVLGPRLIAVSGAQGTTLVAIGSGGWRWGQLLLLAGAAPQ